MPQTVLIVGGDADTREILRVLLRHHGYSTREASTADDAIEAAATDPPALITGEFWVPSETGPCCLPERMRAEPSTSSARILVLTVDAFDGVHQRAKAAGADSLLTKPFELPALVGEIRRLIGPGLAAAAPGSMEHPHQGQLEA